ncbi:hypothetical protein BGZ49_005262 [Haplosporangium sp. Z 27]|nr:hypothetical protein BGZ49_005262 [Haplosporangium sp. Z 27]
MRKSRSQTFRGIFGDMIAKEAWESTDIDDDEQEALGPLDVDDEKPDQDTVVNNGRA